MKYYEIFLPGFRQLIDKSGGFLQEALYCKGSCMESAFSCTKAPVLMLPYLCHTCPFNYVFIVHMCLSLKILPIYSKNLKAQILFICIFYPHMNTVHIKCYSIFEVCKNTSFKTGNGILYCDRSHDALYLGETFSFCEMCLRQLLSLLSLCPRLGLRDNLLVGFSVGRPRPEWVSDGSTCT